MRLVYSISIFLYGLGLRLASPFHEKARLWVDGRKQWRKKLEGIKKEDRTVWVHCASLGEFEQGRPLIEAIRKSHPGRKILLTFFSPSGYEIRKNYSHADVVCYLPLDTRRNARDFVQLVKPELVVFVKYELWVNLHLELASRKVPVVLVSAKMLAGSRFFRSAFKGLYRKVLAEMRHIFTQDEETARLLREFTGHDRVTVAGDTRFDRVAEIAGNFEEVSGIQAFVGEDPCIVCGSTWPKDETLLLDAFEKLKSSPLKWIIAPHEIHADAIAKLCADNKEWMLPYSRISSDLQPWHRILWIDNIGMLSRLYHYADFAYIGGGFDAGIHNILEAAVYGNPVMFGPNHTKFAEAVDLLAEGTAFSVTDKHAFLQHVREWMEHPATLEGLRKRNQTWVQQRTGATKVIIDFLGREKII